MKATPHKRSKLVLIGAVSDTATAKALSAELLEAQRNYLPNFFA